MPTPIAISGNIVCPGLVLSGSLNISGPLIINGVLNNAEGTIVITPQTTPGEPPPRDYLPVLPTNATGPSFNGFGFSESSAYSENGVTASCWKLCNGVWILNGWDGGASTALNAAAPHWWRFKLPVPKWIWRIEARCRTDAPNLVPPQFKLQDMKTGTPVDMLSTGTLPWTDGKTDLDTTTPLFTDDIRIYVGSHSGVLCQLGEVQLFS